MKNAKIWIYPLSIYLAAAVLLSIGCADENKNKRIAIKPSSGGPKNPGSGGRENFTGDPKNQQEVKTIYDKSEDKAIKAAGKSKADDIEKKVKASKNGDLTRAEDIEEGTYEIKWLSIAGEMSSRNHGGFMIYMDSEISDLNDLENAKNSFLSTAKEEEEKKEKTETTSTEETKSKTRSGGSNNKLTREQAEQRRQQGRERREQRAANAEKNRSNVNSAAVNAGIAKAFSYHYGFGRKLTVTKTTETNIEELNPVQLNAYLHPGAREIKIGYSNLGSGAVNDVQAQSIQQILGKSKALSDGTYECNNGNKCLLSFYQVKATGELQVFIREEHTSEGGTTVTKVMTFVFAQTTKGKNTSEKTPEDPKATAPDTQFKIVPRNTKENP